MCALNRDQVHELNTVAHIPKESGVDLEALRVRGTDAPEGTSEELKPRVSLNPFAYDRHSHSHLGVYHI